MLEVLVKCVIKEPLTSRYVMILEAKDGENFIPINIGPFEAEAIYTYLNGISSPKPMTYDFFSGLLSALNDVTMDKVVIDGVDGNVYSAKITVSHSGGVICLNCRPSDAIALGLRNNTPVYVDDEVVQTACCCSKGLLNEVEMDLLEEIVSDQRNAYRNV